MSTDRHIEVEVQMHRIQQVLLRKLNKFYRNYGEEGIRLLCADIPFLAPVEDHDLTKDAIRDHLSERLDYHTTERVKKQQRLKGGGRNYD